ncbi:MAG: 50S ribosomal protein L1 [Phycisphaerae bacterium]
MSLKKSRRYQECLEKVPEGKVSVPEAVKAVKAMDGAKFDQTVELSLSLGLNPRQADQNLRGSVSLPHGIGKTRRVIAFCEGEDVEKAKEAGAVEAGSDELVEKIEGGWMEFDVAVADPQVMKKISRLGRVLGPQGLMPSPKAGTVVEDVATAVREYSAGKVEYRTDTGGNIHVPVGKTSFEDQKLVENTNAMLDMVRRMRPSSVKGTYMRRATLSATMTPSVDLDLTVRTISGGNGDE